MRVRFFLLVVADGHYDCDFGPTLGAAAALIDHQYGDRRSNGRWPDADAQYLNPADRLAAKDKLIAVGRQLEQLNNIDFMLIVDTEDGICQSIRMSRTFRLDNVALRRAIVKVLQVAVADALLPASQQ